jgi:hypothetical protein
VRFPRIGEAMARLRARSTTIDGEAVCRAIKRGRLVPLEAEVVRQAGALADRMVLNSNRPCRPVGSWAFRHIICVSTAMQLCAALVRFSRSREKAQSSLHATC